MRICGSDFDVLCAYSTVKYTTIKDGRLGCCQHSLQALIAFYILIYKVWYQLGYLEFGTVENLVEFRLYEPSVDDCDTMEKTCQSDFTPLSQLSYCCAQNSSCRPLQDNLNDYEDMCTCEYSKAANANCRWMTGETVGSSSPNAMSIATFAYTGEQVRNKACLASDGKSAAESCPSVWERSTTETYFVASIERFMLEIRHVAFTKAGDYYQISDMTGRLLVGFPDGQEPNAIQHKFCADRSDAVDAEIGGRKTDQAPCYVEINSDDYCDLFLVEDLLKAVGISLDDPNPVYDYDYDDGDANDENYSSSTTLRVATFRENGFILRVNINYRNYRYGSSWTLPAQYTYELQRVPKSFSYWPISDIHADGSRTLTYAQGISLQAVAGGQLAKFSFSALLLQLTTSLALLAVATTTVNFLALYVAPLATYYRKALYDVTPDLGDAKFLERKEDRELDEEMRRMSLPPNPRRQEKIWKLLEAGWSTGEEYDVVDKLMEHFRLESDSEVSDSSGTVDRANSATM